VAVPIDLAPADLAGYEDARRALSTQLVAWGQAAGRRLDPDTGEQLLHYKWGYLDDYLARWHCGDLDKILLELFPAKMLLAPDEAAAMIDETRTFLTFLSEAGFLDPGGDSVAVLWRHLSRIGPQMGRRLGDPSLYSWGKRMWLAMAKEGIAPDNASSVHAWLASFHALPMPAKEALLGGPLRNLPAWAGPGRFSPAPVTSSASSSGHRRQTKRH